MRHGAKVGDERAAYERTAYDGTAYDGTAYDGTAYEVLWHDVRRTLHAWRAPDAGQESRRRAFLRHLSLGPDALHRGGQREHVTASALVLSADGRHALLTLHRKAAMWLQLGGHLERGDRTAAAAAEREAREESGRPELQVAPDLVDLDRHELPVSFGRCAAHLDLRYVAVTQNTHGPGSHPGTVPMTALTAGLPLETGSLDLRWWPVDALPSRHPADLPRLIAAALRSLRQSSSRESSGSSGSICSEAVAATPSR